MRKEGKRERDVFSFASFFEEEENGRFFFRRCWSDDDATLHLCGFFERLVLHLPESEE